MDSFITKLRKKVDDYLIELLFTIFTSIIIAIAKLMPIDFIDKVDSLVWFRLVVGLIILCLALFAYIANERRLKYISEFSIWRQKRTGVYFCTSCKINGKKSPLKEYEIGWQCLNKDCKSIFYKPGKEPKSPKRRIISNGISNGWVKNW